MEAKYYLRRKMHEHNLTAKQIAEMAGVGPRFVYEMLAGKTTLRMDKVNDVLRLFDAELSYEYLPEFREQQLQEDWNKVAIPDWEDKNDVSIPMTKNEHENFDDSTPHYIPDDEN